MKIKVVLFDAVGVLFPLNLVVDEELAARFHLSEKQLQLMWKGFYPDYTVGKLTTAEFLDMFAHTYHLPRETVTEAVFTESFLKALNPMPGMKNVLERLHKTEVTLAMLSDTTPLFAHARRTGPFSHYFDHIFLSFEIGYKKPDIRAFQTVLGHYHIQPEEVFFIDDSQENVEAAQQLGIHASHFTTAKMLVNELEHADLLT